MLKAVLIPFGALHGRVYGVVGKVQEKRLAGVLLDEGDGLAGKGVGQVFLLIHRLGAAQDRIERAKPRVEI